MLMYVCASGPSLSFFIILAQIFKQSFSNKSALREESVSTQRAVSEPSVSTKRALREKSESTQRSEHQNKSQYSRSLKYCVLLLSVYKL